MKRRNLSSPVAIAILAIHMGLGLSSRLEAQDSLVALGNVGGDGDLEVSANTVDGVVASVHLGRVQILPR